MFFLNRKHLPASRSAALPDQTSRSAPAVPPSAFWICSMIGTSGSRAPVHPSNGHVRDLIKELHLEHLNSLLYLLCHPKNVRSSVDELGLWDCRCLPHGPPPWELARPVSGQLAPSCSAWASTFFKKLLDHRGVPLRRDSDSVVLSLNSMNCNC